MMKEKLKELLKEREIKRFRVGRAQFMIYIFNFELIGFRYMFLRGWKIKDIVRLDAFHSLEFSIGLISITINIRVKKPEVYDNEEELEST